MKLIRVRSKDTSDRHRTVFDQLVGRPVRGEPSRVIVKADGRAHQVDGSSKLVKEAIERGDLVALETTEDEPKAATDAERSKPAHTRS